MKTHPVSSSHRQRGVALIIMLAFLVLLSGLVVAFFSRAVSERQVSDSSANQTKVELFAQGALETLIGDLKQEMAAGSTTPSATPSPAPKTDLFFPKTAATAVAYRVGVPTGDALPNLVKRSAYQQPFFAGADYDAANYPPADRAANVSTTRLSQNARSWSPARWNKAFLLPKLNPASDTDSTPLTGASGFTPPDWVLVSRDGSNPKTWSGTLANNTNSAFVTGRYAYTIYDEGGLLDMNVAGYPNGVTAGQAGYKSALAFADLTKLRDSSGSALFTQTQIDAFISWRNYASSQPPDVFPSPKYPDATASGTVPSTPGLNYFKFAMGNTKGFMATTNTALYNSQSDRMLASRQQLMKLFLQGIASQGASAASIKERANIQQALQYLGTFSRDVNQPSLIPAETRPKLVAYTSGGNNSSPGAPGVTTPLDDDINPSFLTVRVKNAFTRNNASPAAVGEPLVKNRFALNRLAWLTCGGPIANDSGALNPNSDPAITGIVTALKNSGFTEDFLKKGGPENIRKYFGLTWKVDPTDNQSKWFYDAHNAVSGGPILKLNRPADANDVARANREPDFFELLKASIAVGSLGKAGNSNGLQLSLDSTVDYQVIQIGANIIDQFDVDGFSTRIVFKDGVVTTPGTSPPQFEGIENLPYISGYRSVIMRLQLATPNVIGYYSGWDANADKVTDSGGRTFGPGSVGFEYAPTADNSKSMNGTGGSRSPLTPVPALSKTGVNALMYLPEVWNPHDANSTRCMLDASGNPVADANSQALFPTRFRVVAQSAPPGGTPAGFNTTAGQGAGGNQARSTNSSLDTSVPFPVYAGQGSGGFGPHSRTMTTANTGLYFDIPNNTASAVRNLFREPTLLFKPGVASAGGLTSGLSGKDPTTNGEDNVILKPDPQMDGVFKDGSTSFTSGNGLTDGFIPDPNLDQATGYNPMYYPRVGEKYLGIYVDAVPMAFKSKTPNIQFLTMRQIYGGPSTITLMMQHEYPVNSGKWVTYDKKVTSYNAGNQNQRHAQSGFMPYVLVSSNQSNYAADVVDPRTSRFGFSDCTTALWLSGNGTNPLKGWLDEANGVRVSNRPDNDSGNSGAGLQYKSGGSGPFTAAAGFYPDGGVTTPLFSQNRPDVFSNNRAWNADTAVPPNPLVGTFYTDPDGVVRRATGAYVAPNASKPAGVKTGLAMATANNAYAGVTATQAQSRPLVLNRPFRSVMELGYAFKGTPWKNLDFFTPESGDAGLLDIFCLQDSEVEQGLVAGRVNLNTRQSPVIEAILSGGYKDEYKNRLTPPNGALAGLTATEVTALATAMRTRVTPGSTTVNGAASGPLTNVSELIGKWVSRQTIPGSIGGVTTNAAAPNNISGGFKVGSLLPSYDGFTADLDAIFATSSDKVASTNIQRFRESAIRPLAAVGQTRVWNLMIDLVAQTGRYPLNANALDKFVVTGEQRYWVHLAIDRYTGVVLDQQFESVKE